MTICGAGFAGMAAVKSLREKGITDIRVFERGAEVGGTWYWNRYPGAAVDIQSAYYSYSFTDKSRMGDDGWQFSHKFSKQPELFVSRARSRARSLCVCVSASADSSKRRAQEYAKWVSHEFDLREQMRFQTAITDA